MGEAMNERETLPVPLRDQLACAEREVRMRERVYPRRVAAKAMTQAQADRELRAMAAIVGTLRTLAEREPILGGPTTTPAPEAVDNVTEPKG